MGPLDDDGNIYDSYLSPADINFDTGNINPFGSAANFLGSGGNGLVNGNLAGTVSGIAGKINSAAGNISNSGWNWFGKNGVLPTAFQGLSALGGLMQAYTGLKQLELGREQLRTAKNAFRTQWQNNVESLGKAAENAGKTNYALHHGLAGSFNSADQVAEGNQAKSNATSGYKNYV